MDTFPYETGTLVSGKFYYVCEVRTKKGSRAETDIRDYLRGEGVAFRTLRKPLKGLQGGIVRVAVYTRPTLAAKQRARVEQIALS